MLSRKFLERVLNAPFIDTRKYRYHALPCNGKREVVIVRLPIEYLGTTRALTHWEEVKRIY